MNTRVGIVTCNQFEFTSEDDSHLVKALRQRGFVPVAIPWNSHNARWEEYDVLLLRSCWDYYLHVHEFSAWIEKIGNLGIPIWNQVETVLWNMKKNYISELSHKGIPTIPTRFIDQGGSFDLNAILQETGWKSAVIKPLVSAISYRTHRFSQATVPQAGERLSEMLRDSGAMIQEYWAEVERDGELSLVFFNKEFSHSVRKIAAPGDFRVQKQFGGLSMTVRVDRQTVEEARKALDVIDSSLLYARVDGLMRDNRLTIMEVELIEPVLFFELEPEAAMRFVDALYVLTSH